MPGYHDFRESQRGRKVVEIASRALDEMAALSARGEPAIAAIDIAVADALGALDDTERQHSGRIVRDELARLGMRPRPIRKRLRSSRTFTSGAVYGRVPSQLDPATAVSPVLRPDWEERVQARADEAIAMLARARTGHAGSVDDFIAERRAEAQRDEA